MTWPMLVVLMLPPIAGLTLGLYALKSSSKPWPLPEPTAVRASPLTINAQAALLRERGRCPNFATCPDPVWCQQCGSCDVARQAAASAPRPVEPADLHEALARQWDRLGMPDLAATERDIAAKLRGTG